MLQVVIADKLIDEGQATEKEFQDLYGTDHVMFISGDLTKQNETEGKSLGPGRFEWNFYCLPMVSLGHNELIRGSPGKMLKTLMVEYKYWISQTLITMQNDHFRVKFIEASIQ